jgi:hypothetical protein
VKDGTYTRSWPTDDGIKTRPCVVRGGRVLQLSDARWRDLEEQADKPGIWTYLGPLPPGTAEREVVSL